jgi:hypothetical protein
MRRNIVMALARNRYLTLITAVLMLLACSAGCANDGTVTDYVSLIDNLHKAGATVVPPGEVTEPFFTIKGEVIMVNGGYVEVFEYEDAAAANAEAARISPDGFSVCTPTGDVSVGWVAPPHFYRAGKLIVLYVGESQAVTVVLERVLGPQFAGQ